MMGFPADKTHAAGTGQARGRRRGCWKNRAAGRPGCPAQCLAEACSGFPQAGGRAGSGSQGPGADQVDAGAWCTIHEGTDRPREEQAQGHGTKSPSAWLCAGFEPRPGLEGGNTCPHPGDCPSWSFP